MIAEIEPAAQPSGFLAGFDDPPLYEIIDGKRVDLPPMSVLANRVRGNIHTCMAHHVFGSSCGEVISALLVRLPLPVERNRRPDVAFVSAQTIAQAPQQPGSDNAWDVVPELMVEVVSPHDFGEDIMERLTEYFAAGTRLVWVVYPTQRLIYVYESLRQVRILGEVDELTAGAVLPEFRVPIKSLFPA